MMNKKEKEEVKKLKTKLVKCIKEKYIAKGTNVLLKNRKNRR